MAEEEIHCPKCGSDDIAWWIKGDMRNPKNDPWCYVCECYECGHEWEEPVKK